MEFSKLHKIRIDDFILNWRWTDPKYCLMPENDLKQIYPLDEFSSKLIWMKSLTFYSDESDFSPSPSNKLFTEIENIETENYRGVRNWLQKKLTNCQIVVNWQPNLSVLTNTEIFIKYWDDFCYPSSDDVSIWPEDESWILHYFHHEEFWFGKRKSL